MNYTSMEIQTHFPERDNFGIFYQLRNPPDIRFLRAGNFLRMNPDSSENLRVLLRQRHRFFARFYIRARGDNLIYSGFHGPRQHRLKIRSKFFPLQVGMRINY
jgi:hypothetical protein